MKKILIIEDSVEIRNLIADTLRKSGYQLLSAEDGVEGVELAREHLPDLILCDLKMPRLDGYGTLAALRQHNATATIPFIFLTGVTDKVNVRHGMELGADDYLTKPFTLSELAAAVKTRLDKQEAITRQAEQKLEQLRGSITLAVPHEFLTPLNGIIGFSSLLMEPQVMLKTEEVREFGKNIHHSARRLQHLIENFLVYSQILLVAADPAKVAALRGKEKSAIKEMVLHRSEEKALAFHRRTDLRLELEDVEWPLPAEKADKIVVELLDNAFKFSKSGTAVVVATRLDQDQAVLSILDGGRGMSSEQIAKIGAHMQFDRQLHEQQGSGLGLMIAKGLAELHGGRLSIQGRAGCQTEVRVGFPAGGGVV